MATGKVKWFNPTKGFGFIEPEKGGKDVFVHMNDVSKAGLDTLNTGDSVSFDIATQKGRTNAANLKLLEPAS